MHWIQEQRQEQQLNEDLGSWKLNQCSKFRLNIELTVSGLLLLSSSDSKKHSLTIPFLELHSTWNTISEKLSYFTHVTPQGAARTHSTEIQATASSARSQT